jgi:hypothetical protein
LSFLTTNLLFLCSNNVYAQTVHHTVQIPLTKTNWSRSISVPKFSAKLGMLIGVRFSMQSSIHGTLLIESLDNSAANVVSNLAAKIVLKRPDGSELLTHSPNSEKDNIFSKFDGSADFTGSSGASHIIADTSSGTYVLDPLSESDKNLFTGSDNLILPLSADAVSSFSGGGNLDTESSLSTSAHITVSYIYASPDVTITTFVPVDLVVGKMGQIIIRSENIGTGPTVGVVQVSGTLPGGLPIASINGENWECSTKGQSFLCTYKEIVPAKSKMPEIKVSFNTTDSAFPSITVTTSINTKSDTNAENGENELHTEIPVSYKKEVTSGGGGSPEENNDNPEPEYTPSKNEEGSVDIEENDVEGHASKWENPELEAVAISGEENISHIPDIDAEGCEIPEKFINLVSKEDINVCFDLDQNRKLLFTDIENDPNKRFIEILRKTKIKESGDFILSGDGNPSTGKNEDGNLEFPFSPNRNSSRFEIVKLALITNCIPIEEEIPQTEFLFEDIPRHTNSKDPYMNFVSRVFYTAAKHGIVHGYPDNSARPNKKVNNVELLTFLLRASGSMPDNVTLLYEHEWYEPYVSFAKANNLIDNDFEPSSAMSRSELSALLINSMAINPKSEISSFVSGINFPSQTFSQNQFEYSPVALNGDLKTENYSLSCEDNSPKINSCLSYANSRNVNFSDVHENNAAFKSINLLKNTKISSGGDYVIGGSGNHKTRSGGGVFPFNPDSGASRLDTVKTALISNCISIYDHIPVGNTEFTDLPRKRYPDDPAMDLATRIFYTALSNGIVEGYEDNSVKPFEKVTTLETIAILMRAANLIPENYSADRFAYGDLDQNGWYSDYVSFAEHNGILDKSITTSGPNDQILRSELASLITQIMSFSSDIRVRNYATGVSALLR